jgi:hypothetical protein
MPSGRDSFRRNRVAPFVLFYFTTSGGSLAPPVFKSLYFPYGLAALSTSSILMRELQCAGAEIHIVSFCSSPFTRTFFAVNLSSLRIERR